LNVETADGKHVFEAQVFLDEIDPDAVRLELYADPAGGPSAFRQEMTRVRPLVGSVNGYSYRASVPATRPAADYTARIVPSFGGVEAPLEASPILWQR
jgi:starch phosphorylase